MQYMWWWICEESDHVQIECYETKNYAHVGATERRYADHRRKKSYSGQWSL